MTTTHEPSRAECGAQEREQRRKALNLIRTGLRDYAYWTPWCDSKIAAYLQRLGHRIVGD